MVCMQLRWVYHWSWQSLLPVSWLIVSVEGCIHCPWRWWWEILVLGRGNLRCLWRWNRQSVPKHWHIKFRHWGITQKKAYNIQDMAEVWNQEHEACLCSCTLCYIQCNMSVLSWVEEETVQGQLKVEEFHKEILLWSPEIYLYQNYLTVLAVFKL